MIQVTERDKEVLGEVHRFGYVDVAYLVKRFDLNRASCYRRLRRLREAGYLDYRRILFHAPGVYWLTRLGVELIQSSLSVIKPIRSGFYEHQMAVLRSSLQLTQFYTGRFITERQLRHRSAQSGVGVSEHICDGVLVIQQQRIALEVELSHKSNKRLTRILNEYCLEPEFEQVWYVCGSDSLFKRLTKLIPEYPMLRVSRLSQILQGMCDESSCE